MERWWEHNICSLHKVYRMQGFGCRIVEIFFYLKKKTKMNKIESNLKRIYVYCIKNIHSKPLFHMYTSPNLRAGGGELTPPPLLFCKVRPNQ